MSLRDAIGKDVYIIEDGQFTDSDFQGMPTEDLEKLKLRVSLKISNLSTAIKAKQIDHASGGEGASKGWYINHKVALSINQRILPYINSLIKQRRRAERNIGDYFMDQAKVFLSQNEFESILKKAQLIVQADKGGF
jgi:hypothetical protein